MSAIERLDAALKDFRHSLELLDEPGHFAGVVHQRPATARRLHLVRVMLRAERGVPNTEPDYNPAYFVDELVRH
jgi:hypothetical protein